MNRFLVIAFLLSIVSGAQAQTSGPAAVQSQLALNAEQLDQLVAPIALYPDTLLAEVLMASTYPLEVVEADRWATQNQNLRSSAFAAAGLCLSAERMASLIMVGGQQWLLF